MISKNLYINIIFRVAAIVIFSLLLGYVVFVTRSIQLSVIICVVITFLTASAITFLNSTNRKIRYFFDAVRNDDSNLTFPVQTGEKSLRELYSSMSSVNKQIQFLKIENKQQENYFQTLIEQIATGIITYNRKGIILHANSYVKKLFSVDVLTHIKQFGRIDEMLLQTITNIKPSETRLVALKTERGEIHLSLKSKSFKTSNDELIILSVQDIKNELDEKELDSWIKLIRVLMHEIMNSITPITSLSESLVRMYQSDGNPIKPHELTSASILTTIQGLTVMNQQGKGLLAFVESYRKLTRIPQPDMTLFKVSDLLSHIKVLYDSFENSKKINLSIKIKDPGQELFADKNLISQVLINLLKNAIEANEHNPDGKIEITVATDSNNHCQICVIDNGPGISTDELDKIFVPFFTTRASGSGIGLSVSKQVMRIHGGTINVRSSPNKETIFCLSFQSC